MENECEDDVRESLAANAQLFEDLLINMDEDSDVNICVDKLNKLLSEIFEQYTKSEKLFKNIVIYVLLIINNIRL